MSNSAIKINLDRNNEKKIGGLVVCAGLDNPRPCDQMLLVLSSLTSRVFFSMNFLTVDTCQELLQVSASLLLPQYFQNS